MKVLLYRAEVANAQALASAPIWWLPLLDQPQAQSPSGAERLPHELNITVVSPNAAARNLVASCLFFSPSTYSRL